ncbi:DUF6607 family protein [Raineya sp.]
MRTQLLFSILLVGQCLIAQPKDDRKAIKQMCGCYEIEFNFAETFAYPKDVAKYKPSEVYHEKALEWVELVEESPRKIVLQHILVINDTGALKHWRQDWLYENTHIMQFNGFEDWKKIVLPKDKVKGQWTQKVYQVDDSPRYEGSGSWIHKDGKHYWEATAYSPLPRREFTKRNDYNLLIRRNRHEITPYGWIFEQDNDKVIINEKGEEKLLAKEKGLIPYKKVDDSRCAAAQKWWRENSEFWTKVRKKWDSELAKNQYVKLKKRLEDKPLFMHIFALKNTASQEEINRLIEQFFELKN